MIDAGGPTMTDLIRQGLHPPASVVDVNRPAVPPMRRIAVEGGTPRPGALVPMVDAAEGGTVVACAPVMSESLRLAASDRLRHMATPGGSAMHRTLGPRFRDPSRLERTDAPAGGDSAATGG